MFTVTRRSEHVEKTIRNSGPDLEGYHESSRVEVVTGGEGEGERYAVGEGGRGSRARAVSGFTPGTLTRDNTAV